jgi:hypothetical protein
MPTNISFIKKRKMPTADYSINPGIKYLTNFRQGVVDLMLGPAR